MAIVKDDRTEAEKSVTLGFMVATDKFMSGWGEARNGRSLVACPVVSQRDLQHVEQTFDNRSEFLRVRFVGKDYLKTVRLYANDHLHVYNTCTAFRDDSYKNPAPY